jgi:dethiobiotin synthetase
MQRYFLTGTDTDTGKTLISSALLLNARQLGFSTFGLKPVAAGCEHMNGEWQNSDARLLRQYSTITASYPVHNPIALEAAIAPHIAAQREGIALSVSSLLTACQPALEIEADRQIIEGAGGWLVPLNDTETLADFACALKLPVILVVGMRLGCINHAQLSAQAIQASGLPLAGWVANCLHADMDAQQDNLDYLTQWFQRQNVEHLGTVPRFSGIDTSREEELSAVAAHLHWPTIDVTA